ncbi:MAG: basic rane protein, partial [Thermoleophilaceae bacterium]|nr:basic rane protein [Thermoleophilaceae bacterium]
TKWAFLFEGPQKDGGFNQSFQLGIDAVEKVGDEAVIQDELPYTRKFTQAVSRQIGDGSRVLVEALGAGPLFNSCTKSKVPDVKCYTPVTDPENVPENTVGYWQEEWFLQYIGGYAAGLKTESNITGFVSPFKLPVTFGAINSFALGCRAANPECEVRVVVIESYFDPSKAAKASNTLIDAGADVLSAYVNDPTFCQVAEKRGVFAIGLYTEGFSQSCPKAAIASTIYDFSDYFEQEAKSIRDGTWEGGVLEWVKIGDKPGSPRLSDLNEDITTPELREKVEAEYQKILDGETPFQGPITDNKGEERVPAGETLDDVFLWYGWDWYVEGVVGS